MKVNTHPHYWWDGRTISSSSPTEYEERLEVLLQMARARNRPAPENRKPDIDEWPTVGEPFTWHPDEPALQDRRRNPPSRASHGAWIEASVFWVLLLAGAGIASALFAPEAASFVVGKLVAGDGSDIAERIRSRL